MTHLYSALCLMARRSFAISIAEAFDNLKLIPFLITAVAGILLTVLLFLRKGAVYRSLGCLSLIATVLLLIAQLFSIPILTYTVVIILLLTAIAFQQELREVFLGIFGGSVLPGKKQVAVVDLHHSVIDAVCQAAVEMSRNHTGAAYQAG